MSDAEVNAPVPSEQAAASGAPPGAPRKRPPPGERRIQILQTLAQMLEQPGGERITTAALAAKIDVSEAALYRHFASKAQMFEGLIEFIENSLMGLINKINASDAAANQKAASIIAVVLQFAEKNPGMCRVLTGEALVLENERLQLRITALLNKVEAQLRQVFRAHADSKRHPTPTVDANVRAALASAYILGRLLRYTRSSFRTLPQENLDETLQILVQ